MSLNEDLAQMAKKGKEALKSARTQAQPVLENIAGAVRYGVERGRSTHERVKEKGGYLQVTESALDCLANKIEAKLSKLEATLFTDGEYDSTKANELASRGRELSKKYGNKVAEYIADTAKEGSKIAKLTFRELVPSNEELSTRYAGIGNQYNGFLFRHHFDACLLFHELAEKSLPKRSAYRQPILDDIKASASANPGDLISFYAGKIQADTKARESVALLVAAQKYLS